MGYMVAIVTHPEDISRIIIKVVWQSLASLWEMVEGHEYLGQLVALRQLLDHLREIYRFSIEAQPLYLVDELSQQVDCTDQMEEELLKDLLTVALVRPRQVPTVETEKLIETPLSKEQLIEDRLFVHAFSYK
jgi:hypothetical protein